MATATQMGGRQNYHLTDVGHQGGVSPYMCRDLSCQYGWSTPVNVTPSCPTRSPVRLRTVGSESSLPSSSAPESPLESGQALLFSESLCDLVFAPTIHGAGSPGKTRRSPVLAVHLMKNHDDHQHC